ncbi:MAG: hypothetical protein Q7R82_02345 [Candidatus Daviesbacteria bacterium]|nr:hypothetical protein [Candidatus Daviesbacteria bacterium]
MDSPRWLRLITIGLVLAALATGYFLLSGRLASNSATKPGSQVSNAVPGASSGASPTPSVLGQDTQNLSTPATGSAYNRIVNRTQNNVQTLPATGFPVGLAAAFSVSALISGWGLRRFPR